ncbi:hypothetical protein PF007_g13287 [Phytophthora fragariae]|uniref:Uncharacterized protein n=1 Tax=Phytophthora fragariae TaxID=53985 RepID=A0A6A3S0T2_9STRA|nr:hypothetical protein PF007_g13287 [Phytophthora fragariae]
MGSGPAYTPLAITPTTPVSSAEMSGGVSTSHTGPVTSKRRAQVSSSERQRKVPKKVVSSSSASSKRLSSTPSQLASPSGGDDGNDGSSSPDDSGHYSEGGWSSRSSGQASGGGSDQDEDDSEADGSPDPDSLYRALQQVDRAEPWRLYFRNAPADHPARGLDHLKDKFVPAVE